MAAQVSHAAVYQPCLGWLLHMLVSCSIARLGLLGCYHMRLSTACYCLSGVAGLVLADVLIHCCCASALHTFLWLLYLSIADLLVAAVLSYILLNWLHT